MPLRLRICRFVARGGMPLKVQASHTRRKFESSHNTRSNPAAPSMIVSSDELAVGGANAAIGIKG